MGHDATYLELADELEAALADAGPGVRVVSEHELAGERGVSRPTARAALQELERRFMVRRIRGAGTFTHRRVDYVISPDVAPSASLTLERARAEFSLHIRDVQQISADRHLTQVLEIPHGEQVTRVVRITRLDGVLAAVATAHIPLSLAPGIHQHAVDGVSLYRVLCDAYLLDPVRDCSRASLEVPPADIAAALGVEGRPPMWHLENVNRDRLSGRVTEHTVSWMRADLVRVVFEMGGTR